jgi:hypothetical protein
MRIRAVEQPAQSDLCAGFSRFDAPSGAARTTTSSIRHALPLAAPGSQVSKSEQMMEYRKRTK